MRPEKARIVKSGPYQGQYFIDYAALTSSVWYRVLLDDHGVTAWRDVHVKHLGANL